jgi:hypothetical protein
MKEPIKFYRDEFGIHVYYSEANKGWVGSKNLKINYDLDFDPSTPCVVPAVTSVTEVKTVDYVDYYLHGDGRQLTVKAYQGMRSQLQHDEDSAYRRDDTEAELAASIELRKLEFDWNEVRAQKEERDDCKFEVLDIDYPADDRLFPMRHFDSEKINHFIVDGEKVAVDFAHQLCLGAGLKSSNDSRHQDGTYDLSHNGLSYWRIESTYHDPKHGECPKLQEFMGNLSDCQHYVHTIEKAVRRKFDTWASKDSSLGRITAHKLLEKIDSLSTMVERVASKVRTNYEYGQVRERISSLRDYIVDRAIEANNNGEEL